LRALNGDRSLVIFLPLGVGEACGAPKSGDAVSVFLTRPAQ
jgi:hypothetical protein